MYSPLFPRTILTEHSTWVWQFSCLSMLTATLCSLLVSTAVRKSAMSLNYCYFIKVTPPSPPIRLFSLSFFFCSLTMMYPGVVFFIDFPWNSVSFLNLRSWMKCVNTSEKNLIFKKIFVPFFSFPLKINWMCIRPTYWFFCFSLSFKHTFVEFVFIFQF